MDPAPLAREVPDADAHGDWMAREREKRGAAATALARATGGALVATKTRLTELTGYVLARFVEPEPPSPPLDTAAERARRSVVLAAPPPRSMRERAELVATLNVGHDPRVATHIQRSREHVEDQDAAEAKALALAPHRGRRPVSKEDAQRTQIHREARIMMAAIVNSRGAYVIQSYLLRLRSIFSGQPLARLRAAALGPLPLGGFRWTYADECARRRIATGLGWLVCGRWTDQRTAFGSRSSRRGLLIAGLSVDRILRAVTPVGRKAYERHLFGARTRSLGEAWQGDMALFERHGFALRKRLPTGVLNDWEIGPSGQGKNRYWIGCVVTRRGTKARSQRLHTVGETLGGGDVAFDPTEHSVGWQWATETPRYAPAAPS